jgi:hypothetical protein
MRARLIILSILLVAASTVGASDLWIHVRVTESGHRATTVEVNLPLRLVERLAPLVDDGRHRDSRICLGREEMDVAEFRETWKRLRAGEVVVEDDAVLMLQAGERGEELVVRSGETENESVVTLPASVVDALLSGSGDRLELEAAVSALARHGAGEIVSVRDDGTRVRIWLDREPEPGY